MFFPIGEDRKMLSPGSVKTDEMLNRFRFPPLSRPVRRLRSVIGYNNGKSVIFLCKKHKFPVRGQETLPSLNLAKQRAGRYTDANLRGMRNRGGPQQQ